MLVDRLEQLAKLLRHGSARVRIGDNGKTVSIECNHLWVEMHMQRRLQLGRLVYGCGDLGDYLRSLPDGEYGAADIEKMITGQCQ